MKKGTARLAFGALDQKPDSGLVIIPVGADFSDQTKFGTDVHFNIASPIKVADYYDDYLEHNNRGIMRLTNDLYDRLEETLIQIPRPEDDELSELALAYYNGQHEAVSAEGFDKRNKEERKLTQLISDMSDSAKESLKDQLDAYNTLLADARLKNAQFSINNRVKYLPLLVQVLLAPFGLVNAVFVYFSKFVNKRIPIVFEFITSVFFASVMVAGIIFYSIMTATLATKSLTGLIITISVAIFGYVFARNRFAFSRELNNIRFNRLDKITQENILKAQEVLNSLFKDQSVYK